MFEKAAHAMQGYLQDGLLALKQIFDHQSSSQPCKDNALAAICRIIYTYNPPLPHQVFFETLLKSMPFQGDEEEECAALKGILFLAKNNPSLVLPYKENVIKLIEHDLLEPKKYFIVEMVGELQVFLGQLRQL